MDKDPEAEFLKARKTAADARAAYDRSATETAEAERALNQANQALATADKELADYHRQNPT